MGGFGKQSQGLKVKTAFVKFDAHPDKTLLKYTETWVAGDLAIQTVAPEAASRQGLWVGMYLGKTAGAPRHAGIVGYAGTRGVLFDASGKPTKVEPDLKALENAHKIVDLKLKMAPSSSPIRESLDEAFGGEAKDWVAFEIEPGRVPMPDDPASPYYKKPLEFALIFRWTLTGFDVTKKLFFGVVPLVATTPPARFTDNFVLGLTLLTESKASTTLDYFAITAESLP